MDEFTEHVAEFHRTVAETVAANVRAFRQLRDMDQADLARRMYSVGISWRQVTVSEVERGGRNVTVAELLGLAFALETTIEQLLDTRGPERIRGPHLSFYDRPEDTVDKRFRAVSIPPEAVHALVCTHMPYPEASYPVAEWDDHWLTNLRIVDKEPY